MNQIRIALTALAATILSGCGEEIVEPPVVPDRPTDLTVTLLSRGKAKLEWSAIAGGDGLAYSVYRNDAKIAEVAVTTYVDSTVASNSAYTWFVVAKTENGRVSAPSDPVTLAFGDIDPPKVVTSLPSNNASGVSRIPPAVVTFSESMAASSLTSAITAKITSTGEPIYGTISYNASTRSADFWPLWIIPAQTSVTITVGVTARDLAGNGLVSAFSYAFTTGNSPAGANELLPTESPILLSRNITYKPAENITSVSRELVTVRTTGSGERRLTNDIANDFDASWSPDGRHIAFSSDRGGTLDIFIMREDGTGIRQLTVGDQSQTQPRWSPDGRRIVFLSNKEGEPLSPTNSTRTTDVWIMNADGSGQTNISRTPTRSEHWPSLSPDGQRLLFSAGGRFIVSNIDGSNERFVRPLDPAFIDDVAAWSPDGTQIAFSAFNVNHPAFDENFLLFVMNADGTNVRQLTFGGSQRHPAWSPDGRSLLVSISGFDEFWKRFGKVGAGILDIATRSLTTIAPQDPASEVMSPQSWRR